MYVCIYNSVYIHIYTVVALNPFIWKRFSFRRNCIFSFILPPNVPPKYLRTGWCDCRRSTPEMCSSMECVKCEKCLRKLMCAGSQKASSCEMQKICKDNCGSSCQINSFQATHRHSPRSLQPQGRRQGEGPTSTISISVYWRTIIDPVGITSPHFKWCHCTSDMSASLRP